MFHMLGVMACIGAAAGRVVTHCRLHATGDDSRNNHYADPGRAPFHPWMDAGNAVIRIAHICRYRRVPVFAAIFVAFFAVTGQAGAKNCDGIGCWDKNKFSELVVGEFFSSERKYVQRRMRDINITILGGINQGIIEDIKKITTLLSKRIPYNIFVEENKYENSNTAIIFVDNVPEFFLKDETRDILMKHGMDTNKLKLNKYIWCQFFEFIKQWEIAGSLIVISKLRSFRDIGICATVGLFRTVGILRNLKENPVGMMDKNADLRSDVFGDMKSSEVALSLLEFLYSDKISPGDTADDIIQVISKMGDDEFAKFIDVER